MQSTLATVNVQMLPDKGQRLLKQVQDLEAALSALSISTADTSEKGRANFFFFFFPPDVYKTVCIKIVVNMEEFSIYLYMACGL